GLWLTACTYPIVVIVLPLVMRPGEEGGFFWQHVPAVVLSGGGRDLRADRRVRAVRAGVWLEGRALQALEVAGFGRRDARKPGVVSHRRIHGLSRFYRPYDGAGQLIVS